MYTKTQSWYFSRLVFVNSKTQFCFFACTKKVALSDPSQAAADTRPVGARLAREEAGAASDIFKTEPHPSRASLAPTVVVVSAVKRSIRQIHWPFNGRRQGSLAPGRFDMLLHQAGSPQVIARLDGIENLQVLLLGHRQRNLLFCLAVLGQPAHLVQAPQGLYGKPVTRPLGNGFVETGIGGKTLGGGPGFVAALLNGFLLAPQFTELNHIRVKLGAEYAGRLDGQAQCVHVVVSFQRIDHWQ